MTASTGAAFRTKSLSVARCAGCARARACHALRVPPAAASTTNRSLVTAADVQQELVRLFGGMSDRDLVVSVYGDEDADGAVSTFHELMRSFEMHGGAEAAVAFQDSLVKAPDALTIERALLTLSQPELQPYLDRILPSALQGWLRLPGQGSELGAGAAARGGGRIRVVDPGSAAG